MTIGVPEDKLEEIKSLIHTWLSKPDATVLELQSLIGKLLYVCSCIHPGHLLMQRLLNVLCSHYSTSGSFQILAERFDDLKWWSAFLNVYNGVSSIPEPVWVSDPSDFSVDAIGCECVEQPLYQMGMGLLFVVGTNLTHLVHFVPNNLISIKSTLTRSLTFLFLFLLTGAHRSTIIHPSNLDSFNCCSNLCLSDIEKDVLKFIR